MTLHLFELAGLMVLILLVSATLVLWMQSTKRRPNPMLKVLLLVVLIVFCLGSMKYAGKRWESFSQLPSRNDPIPFDWRCSC